MNTRAQINLLIKPPIASPAVLWGLAIIFLALFGHLAYAGYLFNKARTTEARVAAIAQEKTAIQSSLSARSVSGPNADEIKKEMDSLRQRAGDLLAKLESAPPGRKENFARELVLLAQADSRDVWLNQITIEGATGVLTVSGKALSSKAVFDYANRLNRLFEPHEIAFKAVEITEPTETSAQSSGGQSKQVRTKTVTFKLQ